jgi:predicted esterase
MKLRKATILLLTTLVSFSCPWVVGQDDIADVRSKRFRMDGDRNLQYELIGAPGELTTPEDGYKLLVVLPGGDGGADFTPFVKRIWKYSLDDSYFIVQLIAPEWNKNQRVVWPTKELPETGMKTSTEEFLFGAVAELQSRTKINDKHIFALGWSSGGPAAYATSVTEGSPLTGTFAAMSVFKPSAMGDLAGAKGHAYYLLHSQNDQVCPFRMAEEAAKVLQEHGAKTKLVTYEGGHGWQGDVFGNIRAGVAWLEQQTTQ